MKSPIQIRATRENHNLIIRVSQQRNSQIVKIKEATTNWMGWLTRSYHKRRGDISSNNKSTPLIATIITMVMALVRHLIIKSSSSSSTNQAIYMEASSSTSNLYFHRCLPIEILTLSGECISILWGLKFIETRPLFSAQWIPMWRSDIETKPWRHQLRKEEGLIQLGENY